MNVKPDEKIPWPRHTKKNIPPGMSRNQPANIRAILDHKSTYFLAPQSQHGDKTLGVGLGKHVRSLLWYCPLGAYNKA